MTAFVKDAAERVVLTFIEAFVAVLIIAPSIDVSTLHAAEAAGLAGALTLIKTLIAGRISGTVSPASLAPAAPTDDAGAVNPTWIIAIAVVGIAVLILTPGLRLHT